MLCNSYYTSIYNYKSAIYSVNSQFYLKRILNSGVKATLLQHLKGNFFFLKKKEVSTSSPCGSTVIKFVSSSIPIIKFSFLRRNCYQLLVPMPPLLSISPPCVTTVTSYSSLCHHWHQLLIPASQMLSTRPCATTVNNFSYLCYQCYQLLIPVTLLISTSRPSATHGINSCLCHQCYQLILPVPSPLPTSRSCAIRLINF